MANYTGIKGYKIQSLAADPSPVTEGQLWYDTATDDLKYTGPGTGAWSTGGDMTTPRRGCANFGIQTAAVAGGGGPPPSGTTEEYDGTSWGSGGTIPGSYDSNAGCGTLTAGLSFLGYSPGLSDACFEYDGSTWTTGGTCNTARGAPGGLGTQTAALAAGGQGLTTGIPTALNCESYNGASWSTENGTVDRSQLGASCGTSTAGLWVGYSPATGTPPWNNTNEWNGTSWVVGSPGMFNTNMYAVAAFGTQSAAIKCGGLPPTTDTEANMTSAESYDGSTWTSVASRNVDQASGNGAGTATSGLAFGGYNPLNAPAYDTDADKTEEWSQPDFSTKTVTVS